MNSSLTNIYYTPYYKCLLQTQTSNLILPVLLKKKAFNINYHIIFMPFISKEWFTQRSLKNKLPKQLHCL